MDRTPDPTTHPDLDTLADYEEGLLDETAAGSLTAHLVGCAACAGSLRRLQAVGTALAALPSPPLPADLAARIDAALAAAGGRDGEQAGQGGQAGLAGRDRVVPAAATVLASTGGSRWRSRLPALAAAASFLAVVGALAFILSGNGGNHGGASSTTAAKGGAAAPAAAALGHYVVNDTGRHYSVDSLRSAVPQLLAGGQGQTATGNSATSSYGPNRATSSQTATGTLSGLVPALGALHDPAALRACVQHIGANPAQLLAVDYAYFGATPVAVLVFPDPADRSRVDIYVAGSDCATNPNPLSQLVIANR